MVNAPLHRTAALVALVLAAALGAAESAVVDYLHVTGAIENSYAVTLVEERLTNPLDTKLDATFAFQVPEGAFVSNLTLLIDGVLHVARVVPKEEARERYAAAVAAGRDAGLMEQAGKELFTYSVSFSPRQTIVVGLRYEQYLSRTLDVFEYPLVINPGRDQAIGELSVDVSVSSYKDLASVEVPTHPELSVEYLGTDRARVHLEKRGVSSTEELLVRYRVAATSKAGVLLDHVDANGERYFFHVFAPVADELGGPLDKDIVFVLDKSGSMGDAACGGERKVEQMKKAFAAVVGQLHEGDTFNVVEFDTEIAVLWPEPRQATDQNREEAASRIRAIAADGSTNIAGALESALGMLSGSEERVPVVVMLTDGLPTAGITNTALILKNLKESNKGNVSIFCLGLGNDVDFPFLRALSLQNWGHAVRIYPCSDVSEQIGGFYRTISTPLLRDLRFTYGEGAVDVYPTAAQRLFAGSEVVVAGRYVGEGGSLTVQISGRSRGGTVTFSDTLRFVGSRENAFIPRFWAFMRIQDLLERIAAWGENDVIVGDIVNTSIRFNFVTPYTSLFLEVEALRPEGAVEEGEATAIPSTPPLPAATSRPAATGRPATATQPTAVPVVGGSYIGKMANGIMGMSDEVSDSMRERILNDIKTKNEKVMLSIPTSIKITRKTPSRDIVVGINNIDPEEKCFCVYPHLLNLDGPGSYDYKIDKDFSTLRSQYKGGTFNDALKEKLKRYSPSTCWEGSGACEPNKWFVGAAGVKVNGEQQNSIKVSMEIPKDPLAAPDGRWAFSFDVCEYRAAPGGSCGGCVADNCRQDPERACSASNQQDCYIWYDAEEFHLQVLSGDASVDGAGGGDGQAEGSSPTATPADGAGLEAGRAPVLATPWVAGAVAAGLLLAAAALARRGAGAPPSP